MRSLIWGKTFFYTSVKKDNKKEPETKNNIENRLSALAEEPFAPKLETHKLRGKLLGSWA